VQGVAGVVDAGDVAVEDFRLDNVAELAVPTVDGEVAFEDRGTDVE